MCVDCFIRVFDSLTDCSIRVSRSILRFLQGGGGGGGGGGDTCPVNPVLIF